MNSDFHKNKLIPDGLAVYCKICTTFLSRRNHIKRYPTISKNPELVRKRKEYIRSFTTDQVRELKRNYNESNKSKVNARSVTSRAIKSGKLIQLPCEVCGFPITEAHHDDYSKPLNVRWLCVKHHKELHRKYKYE
jgi:hypothetical protein